MNTSAGHSSSRFNAISRGARARKTVAWRIVIMVNVSGEGQIFRCEICGNVVVVKEAGGGELICCGEPMQLEE